MRIRQVKRKDGSSQAGGFAFKRIPAQGGGFDFGSYSRFNLPNGQGSIQDGEAVVGNNDANNNNLDLFRGLDEDCRFMDE